MSRARAPKPRPIVLGERLLKGTPYAIRVEGPDVVVTVGRQAFRIFYTTALDMASYIHGAAKIAKRNAGDTSLRVTGFAHLTDANLDEREAQANRDRTAVFSRVK